MSTAKKPLSSLGSTVTRGALALLAAGAVMSAAGVARAQADVNPPLPNVMLLVDTSGSMEYKSSSTSFPTCDPTGSTPSEKSRWIDLLEVLTGSIENYRCDTVNRSSAAFLNEYSLNGTPPPDYHYTLPYHRPMSGDCTPGPGVLPTTNAYDFPPGAIAYHAYESTTQACAVPFSQARDGLLDSFETRVRFGLMTFDTEPDPGTGVSGTTPDYPSGVAGTWSYFVNQPHQGKPAGCSTLANMEVGARNAAAPPWEGRMVAFGDPNAGGTAVEQKNEQIQQILLATRPYGATPIAGLLDDARDFFWNDTSKDPENPNLDFGPRNDPYVAGGCRKNYIVLLTDGEPNLDLRPYCEGAGPPAGVCPYQDTPEQVAFDLANAADPTKRIETFVIGFALSKVTVNGTTVDCTKLTANDIDPTNPSSLCAQNQGSSALQACCTLSRIAYNGGTDHAYFASDMDGLRSAMSAVLSQIASSTSSRTLPVFASSSNPNDSFAGSYRFFSSFQPQQFDLWSGVLERQRYVCVSPAGGGTPTPQAQPIDPLKGDDFVANVDSGKGTPRVFYSVTPDLSSSGGLRFSQRSIRPALTSNVDGAGLYGGTEYNGQATDFDAATSPASMSIDSTTCANMSADQCRDKYLKWLLGLPNGTSYSRCTTPGSSTCNLVGDIYHSTPALVGRPSALLRDQTYDIFSETQAMRPLVLYTSTNDGFLHAFEVAPGDPKATPIDTEENNELWAFIPPAVMPSIPSEYPSTHQLLLDGAPVVRDVVAEKNGTSYTFQRGAAVDANSTWRTVLVQGFGAIRGGYFALDVTDPVPNSADPNTGPRFLWQLTEDANGAPLFGTGGAKPLITTLFFDPTGGDKPIEVPVAVLPGGKGGAPTGAKCNRQDPNTANVDSAFPPRTQVNCYPSTGIGARSLTIVRLDTGEIIRTFRQSTADAPAGLSGRVTVAPIDSPITGQPVAYPGDTGAIADRIFVGDADGTLWRVDVSSIDPSKWTMSLFFDAYSGQAFDAGQPIDTAPILSLDRLGNVTVAFSSGDQDVLTASGNNFVYSLTEKLEADDKTYASSVNWFTELTGGERVAGPMTLFNSGLYFSTFKPEPPGTNVCSSGSSRVWGVDYITPEDPGDKSKGGKGRLPQNPNSPGSTLVQYLDDSSSLLAPGAEVFGVGVAQVPTCVSETQLTDPYFGTGTHTSVTSVNPGQFQLVMNTGSAGTAISGGKSNVTTINLPAPVSSPHIDSWAAITQ